jgi:cleavage and polyadenylation specificity factor subunit 3
VTSTPHPHSHSHSHSHPPSHSTSEDQHSHATPKPKPKAKSNSKPTSTPDVTTPKPSPTQQTEYARLHLFLNAHFGEVTAPRLTLAHGDAAADAEASVDADDEDNLMVMDVRVDGKLARLDLISMKVESEDDELKSRVESVVQMAMATMKPLSRIFIGSGLDAVKGEGVLAV